MSQALNDTTLIGDANKFAIAARLQPDPEADYAAPGCEGSWGEICFSLQGEIISSFVAPDGATTYPTIQCELRPMIEWLVCTAGVYTSQTDVYPTIVYHELLQPYKIAEMSAADAWTEINRLKSLVDKIVGENTIERAELNESWNDHCLQAACDDEFPALYFMNKGGAVEISCNPFTTVNGGCYTKGGLLLLPTNEFVTIISELITWFMSQPIIRRQKWYNELFDLVAKAQAMALPVEETPT